MSEAIAVRGKDTPVSALNNLLIRNQKQIELALPKHLRPERLIRLAVTALNVTPKLQDCSLLSIANSVMLAAQLGLEPNNGLGHGWLIPYKQVCTFQPGYRGFLDLAYRTKRIRDSRAVMVYSNEPFVYEEGAHPRFEHTPWNPERRGQDWIGAYSRLSHVDGFESVYWMWKQEILDIRDKCSKAAEKKTDKWGNPIIPIWEQWFDEMVKKTVIKRHLKMCQLSNEIGFAVGIDDEAEAHAAKEETPKIHTDPVQDLVLDQALIDDARQADDELQASSQTREEVKEKKVNKFKKAGILADIDALLKNGGLAKEPAFLSSTLEQCFGHKERAEIEKLDTDSLLDGLTMLKDRLGIKQDKQQEAF